MVFAIGLGCEVRPELALVSAVFLMTMWFLIRPSWRQALLFGVVAGLVPAAYEIFRAGYYGVLLPLPAITKEASQSNWGRGWSYVAESLGPYWLWVPLCIAVAAWLGGVAKVRAERRDLVVHLAPAISAGLLMLFVVRVGGDYMNSRMVLSPVLLLLLPTLLVPVTRAGMASCVSATMWAVLAMSPLRHPFDTPAGDPHTQNIRRLSIQLTGRAHPVSGADWSKGMAEYSASIRANLDPPQPSLAYPFGRAIKLTPLRRGARYRTVHVAGLLGLTGATVPLEDGIVDAWSLAYPLGAHFERPPKPPHAVWLPGHEKWLPPVWLFADWADPDRLVPPPVALHVDRGGLDAARHTLRCSQIGELVESVRAPMTPGRFLRNLTGSLRRTQLRIPMDPLQAEARYCGSSQPRG